MATNSIRSMNCKPKSNVCEAKCECSGVKKFFEETKKYSILTGGVTDRHIKEIEKDLKVTLPDSYKWFLTEYGSGGAFGTMILVMTLMELKL